MSYIQQHQTQSIKGQIYNLHFIKIKNDCALKTLLKKWKDKPQTGGEEEIFAKHRSFIRLVSRIQKEPSKLNDRKTIQFKNRQSIWRDTSPKKIHKWQISAWKDAQHHWSLRVCKLTPQWDITSIRMLNLERLCQVLARMWRNWNVPSQLAGI